MSLSRKTAGNFVCALIFILPWVFQCRSHAADQQTLDLSRQVEIRRTAYGVPHIKGLTEAAAAFGFGYAQAEDHVQSIMRLVLAARGELARNFGGERNIAADFESRQFRVFARAQETYHRLDPDFRSVLEGFALGFNYYVERHRKDLPDWVQPITPHDVAAHGMSGVMRFAFDRGNIIGAFVRSKKQTASVEPKSSSELAGRPGRADVGSGEPTYNEDRETGSNMWAFAPSRTTSGQAILMGNPHQPWAEVSTYYEAHVTVAGKLDFYGSTFVGRPILTTGFNEHLGWTHTVNYADLEEIYELDLDPKHSDYYILDGGSVPISREEVALEYKDGDTMKTASRTFEHTPLGPVILRTEKNIYVFRSACYEEYRAYQQWYQMSKAKNYKEFRKALDMMAVPMFNVCYADREGNIYYIWNGTVPMLPHPAHLAEAVHATRSSDIWTRFHPLEDLPQLFNPKGGYVQNCNDPPYLTNLQQPLDPGDYPSYFGRNRLGLRTQHSLLLVDNKDKYSLEDVRDMKFSMKMLLADRVKEDLVRAIKASPDRTAEVKEAVLQLLSWDNSVAADSKGSVLFETWWGIYNRLVGGASSPDSPPMSEAYKVAWSADDPIGTPDGLGKPDLAVKAFSEAIEQVAKKYGKWDVTWGEVHRVRKGKVDLPVGGGSGFLGCFRVLGFRSEADGRQVVNGGDSWIFVVQFGKNPKAYSVVGYSQSENESSPHFSDQAELFTNNEMKRVAFRDDEIEAQLLQRYYPGEEKALAP